jgi:hypothetical protein
VKPMTKKTPLKLGQYADVPSFIYGITREIWEERGAGTKLDKYYATDIKLRAPTGYTGSNAGVLAQTLQTLHQFPDRRLVGEDVIWHSLEDGSFLSSHRLMSVMTHTGDGALGKATGMPVRSRIIADCWVKNQVVIEEWLVRDQAALAYCLGSSPKALAEISVASDLAQTGSVNYFLPAHDKKSRYPAAVSADPEVQFYCQHLQAIWQSKDLAAIRSLFFHGADFHAPGGKVCYGHDEIDQFVVSYLASFPDAKLRIKSAFANHQTQRPARIAVRWEIEATHSGYGHFGEPTGAPIYIMGLSHANMSQTKVMSEWFMTDEVSVWKQILAHQRKI